MKKQVRYTVREIFAQRDPQEREKVLERLMREYLRFLEKKMDEGGGEP